MIDKIKSLASKSGLIGGRCSLIVGNLGCEFQAIHYPSYDKMQRVYKEGDKIPIVRVKDDKVSIVPFCHEIWIRPDDRFKGISYLVNNK